MKKLLMIVSCMLITLSTINLHAEDSETEKIMKERKELRKMSRKALNEKASKDARKEAKQLKKQGWKSAPGALPLEKQLDRSYMMQQEYDEDMFPKYILGTAQSIGENFDGAKMQAMELAKLDLAGQIQTEVTALAESNVANKQMSENDAATVTKTVMGAKNLISQSIGRVIPIVEVYRDTNKGTKEVRVTIAYNAAMAKEAAKKAIRQELEDKGEELIDQLDKAMGW
ncbi:MAG: hypothetical protein IJY31_03510 [Muribaculaceae bacterium]|nr:hypothetical protein [Muribaculaceae bacterium]